MNLFAELKRRNVFRVALFYLVASWLIVQIAETVLPVFDVPDAFVRGIIVVLALGFVPALVFAWAFELTAEGLKRDRDVERVDPATKQQTAQKLNWATLIAALLAIGVVIADRILPGPESAAPPSVPSAPVANVPEAPSEVQAPARPSIAVLPFVNMSPDADNAFFADGISEELLNILAGIDGLAVASRTSAFSFRGDTTPIPEIAEALGVRYVLEGSVRKQGDRVRITSQLIDAESDVHMWSDTYERELTDIFRVQESIARSITEELSGLLVTTPVSVDAPTADLEAYQHFLRGRSLFYQRQSLDDAMQELKRATELDPGFAEAWAFLAATEYVTGNGGYETEMEAATLSQRARESVDRALELDPTIPIAIAAKGQLLMDSGNAADIEQGMSLLESASEALAPDSTPTMWLGINLLLLGDLQRAQDVFQQALAQDPLVPINNGYVGVIETTLGNRREALQHAIRSLELSGWHVYWVWMVAIDASNAGDTAQAAEILARAEEIVERNSGDPPLSGIDDAVGEGADFSQWIERHPPEQDLNENLTRVFAALLLGDLDSAIALAKQGRWVSRSILIQAAWMPSMQALREHPGFFDVISDLGFIEYWRGNRFPLGCAPVTTEGVEHLACGDRE